MQLGEGGDVHQPLIVVGSDQSQSRSLVSVTQYRRLEIFTKRSFSWFWFFWVAIAVFAVVIMSTISSMQFECFDFCTWKRLDGCPGLYDFASNNATSLQLPNVSACVNPVTGTWQSGTRKDEQSGLVVPIFDEISNPLRRFNQFVIRSPSFGKVRPGTVTSSSVLVLVTDTTTGESTLHAVADLRFQNASFFGGAYVVVDVPVGMPMPSHTSQVSLTFVGGSPFSSDDGDILDGADIRMAFVTSSVGFNLFDVCVRYIVITFGVGVLIYFIGLTSVQPGDLAQQEPSVAVLLSIAWRRFSLRKVLSGKSRLPRSVALPLALHLAAIFTTDPFVFGIAGFPSSSLWQFWAWQFLPWLRFSALFVTSVVVSRGSVNLGAGTRTWVTSAVIPAGLLVVGYFVAMCVAASRNEPSYPPAVGSGRGWVCLATTSIMYMCASYFIVMFVFRRTHTLWKRKQGVHDTSSALYAGEQRSLVLFLRLFNTILFALWLFLGTAYFAIVSWFNFPIPTYLCTQPIEVVILVALSSSMLLLLAPMKLPIASFPPNANETNTEQFDFAGDLMTSPAAASILPVALRWSPLWVRLRWTPLHFQALRTHQLSGYAFTYESQRAAFDDRHRGVSGARSFFCWETAVSALNLSNEVYNELNLEDEEDVAMVIEVQQNCFERCVSRCLCLGCGGGGSSALVGGAESRRDEIPDIPATSSRRFAADPSTTTQAFVPPAADEQAAARSLESSYSSSDPVGTTVKNASNSPTQQQQQLPAMDVDQFGFTLLKAMDVGSVRFLVARSADRNSNSANIAAAEVPPQLVIAFRGTANARNAIIDVNFVRTVWPDMSHITQGKAKVHNGFGTAWLHIVPHLKQALEQIFAQQPELAQARIVCTGHSLGGAIATLCMYSLQAGELRPVRQERVVSCYTFGAPRIGNETFVKQYNAYCSETYRVVNENDAVVWIGHCGRQHSGKAVSINRDGDALVEDNLLESLYRPVMGNGSSVKNHLLERYSNSIDNALCARNLNVASLRTFVGLAREQTAHAKQQ